MTISKDDLRVVLNEFFSELAITEGFGHSEWQREHKEQHEWLKELIESEKERRRIETEMMQAKIDLKKERRRLFGAITRAVIGWSIPTLLTGFWVWHNTGHWPSP